MYTDEAKFVAEVLEPEANFALPGDLYREFAEQDQIVHRVRLSDENFKQ